MKTAQLAQAIEMMDNMSQPFKRMAASDLLNEKGHRVLFLYVRTREALTAYQTVSAMLDGSTIAQTLAEDAEESTEARILYNYLTGLADAEFETIQEGQ